MKNLFIIFAMLLVSTVSFAQTKVMVPGLNADIDTAGAEDVWPAGGVYAWPAAAAATTIVSSSANDAAAGTGARTVRVSGLLSTYREASETVTMNGVTPVALTNSFLRINSVEVLTAGSGLVNAGTIDVKHTAVVISEMAIGANKAQGAIFTTSANYRNWQIRQLHYSITNAVAGAVTFKIYTKKTSGLWLLRWTGVAYGTAGDRSILFSSPIVLDTGEDVKVYATTTADNTAVVANLELIGSNTAL